MKVPFALMNAAFSLINLAHAFIMPLNQGNLFHPKLSLVTVRTNHEYSKTALFIGTQVELFNKEVKCKKCMVE